MQDVVSPLKIFFRQKWVRIILIIDVLAILIVAGIIIHNATKVSIISFNIAPVDAVISVNGNTSFTNNTYKITPGTYEIKISHDNLETKTFTIDIAPHDAITFTAFLKDVDEKFSFYESKENNLTYDNDVSAEEFIKKVTKALGIFELLPIKGYIYEDTEINTSTAGFAIKDGRSSSKCEKIACLLINYYGHDYEELVTEKIQEAGYDPENYQLIYERYKNA